MDEENDMETKEHRHHKASSSAKSRSKHDVLHSARKYIRRHWKVVPIRPNEKVPRRKEWQNERIKESEIPDYFHEDDNIGILWGEPSHWLVDVDLDCNEAVMLAPRFLPKTDRVCGRESRLTSHYVYKSKGTKSIKFSDPESADPKKACLLELRSTGLQSIVPPSIHPSGEFIWWEKRGDPACVTPDELRIAVGLLAAAALLARRWKLGIRNEVALSLSGALLRAGRNKEQVIKFVEAVVFAAGDEELKKRVAAVEAMREKIAKGEKVTGIPRLAELLGEKTVSSICKWLGIGEEKSVASVDQLEEAEIFHSYEDFENAPPIRFSIEGILQNGCATMIAGLSGHGKTLVMLSMAKALLKRHRPKKLWHQFKVLETASRVLYLIPESGITPLKERLKHFHLYHYLKDGRLLVHTLSKGPTPDLSNPKILAAAKDAYVFLDPMIRFEKGNENEAADNQRGLANDIFALLRAGARAVIAAHHAPKNFSKEKVMTLENMLRGTGDIGAMVATAWGIKQLDPEKNIIHVENLKARDFKPCGPFQIIGRPYINEEGDFRIHKKPGECGSLGEEQKSHNKGGAPLEVRKAKAERKRLLSSFLEDDPDATSPALVERFKQEGINIADSTVRSYLRESRKDAKNGS
jgi:hypothetical protein